MTEKYKKGQNLCCYSNGKFHRVIWHEGKMYKKCNWAVGYIKLSQLMYNYNITCKNCLR